MAVELGEAAVPPGLPQVDDAVRLAVQERPLAQL